MLTVLDRLVLACLLVCGAAILTDLARPVSLGPALARADLTRLETTSVRGGTMLAAFALAFATLSLIGRSRDVTADHAPARAARIGAGGRCRDRDRPCGQAFSQELAWLNHARFRVGQAAERSDRLAAGR